jgi:L,D-peptidoglycan transpeptidase YkuD (ErfK/YbiS/YcfS/YnhG family)
MPDYVFGQRARKPSDVKLAYRHIGPHSWWSSEKGSHYNTWFTAHRRVDGEHLIDYRVAYEYALSTGYNAKPNTSVYGRGSGIFLHVWQGATTSGCVSVPLATMQRVFRTMDPAKRRVFVIGTLGANDPTRVDRY